MQIGDVIMPLMNRFPPLDRSGQPTLIEDEAVGQVALVRWVYQGFVEVVFVETGQTAIYRFDEIEQVSDRATWLADMAGVVC